MAARVGGKSQSGTFTPDNSFSTPLFFGTECIGKKRSEGNTTKENKTES